MDTIRFLSFLQDFATANSSRSGATAPGGTNLPPADLTKTLSAFETQLRALMNTTSTQTSAQSTATGTIDFVVGEGAKQGVSESSMAATEAMINAMLYGQSVDRMAPAASVSSASSVPDDTLREIIAWRREQIDPMLHEKVGDLWERQGITDPMSDPKLLAEAQHAYERAMSRKAQMPGLVAHWEGDWRTQQALADQNRQRAGIEGAKSQFVVGGDHQRIA